MAKHPAVLGAVTRVKRFRQGGLALVLAVTALGVFVVNPVAHAALLGPTPYLRTADSPFAADITAGTTLLEDFEDGLFNTPGVTSFPAPLVCSEAVCAGITDSVDGDDGVIDGSGLDGHSGFSVDGALGFTFTFTGPLPTQAGVVWTDGRGDITFEAFGPDGFTSLGTLTGTHAGSFITGQTDEDRFYGVTNAAGISKIFISNASGGIEVDHLQFGNPATDGRVPEPGTLVLVASGLAGLGAVSWRRRRSG